MTWQPEAYLTFGDERTRPARDLLTRVPVAEPVSVVDLGCGPANATALLAERWPRARLIAVDNSPEMLAKARESGVAATFVDADIATWRPDQPVDVVFSNAALHWVQDHDRLFVQLLGMVSRGGALAVQMPLNLGAPAYELMRESVRALDPGLAGRLARRPVLSPGTYYDLLAPHARLLDLWMTEYLHVLEGKDPILRWLRSTALRPVQEELDPAAYQEFERAYAPRLRTAYPMRADGRTLFPFQRLFLVAHR